MSALGIFSAGFPLGGGTTVPWFVDFRQCESLGGKLDFGDGVYRFVDFGDRIVFGELKANVSLSFYTTVPEFRIRPTGDIKSEVEAFDLCFRLAVAAFGAPTDFTKDDCYPGALWRDGPLEVRLGVGNRFTDYFTFSVSRSDWCNQHLLRRIRRRTLARVLFRLILPTCILIAIAVVGVTRCAA
jgi:hypothetical protein